MMYNQKLVTSVKCKGKIMREQGDTVFLPFGEEYSILLKNLSTQKAQIKVEIDGETVISALLLSPNQSIDLERYVIDGDLSKGPRFKFIEKTSQISNHRGDKIDDGIIRVTYQFEEVKYCQPTVCPYITYTDNPWSNKYYGDLGRSYLYDPSVYSTISLQSNDNGITTKGSESTQKFVYSDIGTLESTVHSIILQLKGDVNGVEVEKPLTVKRKIKCDVCGNINKSSSSYCSNCGTNLTYQY